MVEINNLAFSYGRTLVLNNISLNLEPGRIYGLLGENGVGKTTLLTLIAGLKKPQQGNIIVNGENPYDRTPSFLSNIYYLPDEVSAPNDPALDWARSRGVFWPSWSEEKFKEIMAIFENDITRKMNCMSAGQLKKTHISFALAAGTAILLMDEPTNGLDIPSKSQFRSALMRYTREDSIIVISTHQVRDLENVIDPIIILDRQDVLLNASLEEISSRLQFDYGQVIREDSLYSEQLPGGFIQVRRNNGAAESKVNIEALFNAVHKNKTLIKEIFSHE